MAAGNVFSQAALGARRVFGASLPVVISLVAAQSLRLVAIGLPAGILLALGAARLFAWRVMMLQAFALLAYVAGTLVVIVACIAASCVPAFRAARIDPMTTPRAD